MPAPDFAALFRDLDRFHEEAAKVAAQLASPKQRKILGEALDELKEAKAEIKQTLPSTVQLLKDKAEKTKAESQKFRAEQAQRDAERQQAVEQAKEAAAKRKAQKKAVLDSTKNIAKPKLPKVEMPQEWGQQLGGELLERFGRPVPVDLPPSAREGEIWEDWQWEK